MGEGADEFDRRLLGVLQGGLPLVIRPFQQVAAELGVPAERILGRVAAMSAPGGIIRRIAGIFDAAGLGYATTLVAARCPPDGLDRAAAEVAAHPGVSHCYGRTGALNLWFTLAVPADSRLGLDGTIEVLRAGSGALHVLSLPAQRRYKLDARFDAGPEGAGPPVAQPLREPHLPEHRLGEPGHGRLVARPDPEQVRAIRVLQKPLPAVPEPFAPLAAEAGMSADDLLVHAADFLACGWMRRYAAVLRHQLAGAKVNVLVAWEVPPARADAFGLQAARFRRVSHCYLRRTGEGWPYNLYTMVHAGSAEEADAVISAIAAAGGDFPHARLPTTREYKKAPVELFSPDLARWESAAGRLT